MNPVDAVQLDRLAAAADARHPVACHVPDHHPASPVPAHCLHCGLQITWARLDEPCPARAPLDK